MLPSYIWMVLAGGIVVLVAAGFVIGVSIILLRKRLRRR